MTARTFFRSVPRGAWFTTGVAAVAAVGLSVWAFGFAIPSQADAAQTVTRTATAALRTMEKTVSTTGTVTPAIEDSVSFAVSGTVTAVKVAAGDTVKKGQTLATVDTLQLKADLLQAKADLAEAKATLASAEDAADGTSAATAQVSAAEAAVKVAKASVSDAEDAMDDATLVAPDAGLVSAVDIAVGDKISSGSSGGSSSGTGGTSGGTGGSSAGGQGAASTSASSSSSSSSSAAFTIVSTDSWAVDVSVGETDIANVTKGDQVELSTDDGTAYYGTVSEVGLLPSTTSGSAEYPVTIAITGKGKGLFDGVSVDISIVYERRTDVLAVPSMAVTTADGTSTVTVVASDGTQKKTTVKTGDTADDYTEITSGLSEGDSVLVASFTPRGASGDSGTQNSQNGTGRFPGGGEMPSGGFPGGSTGGQGGGFPGGQGGNQ